MARAWLSRASAADSLKEVENAFEALVGQGLHPLAAALEKGDMAGYQSYAQNVLDALEGRFGAIAAFGFWRASELLDAHEVAGDALSLRAGGRGRGRVLAALLVFSTYLFLRRRVLQPLREVGQHFDKIAAGDLTARGGRAQQ